MKYLILSIAFLLVSHLLVKAQCAPTSSNCILGAEGTNLIMTTSGNVEFVFDDLSKYIRGITKSGSTRLRLKIEEKDPKINDCKWALMMYISTPGAVPANEWETLVTYGAGAGDIPDKEGLIQVRVYNGCNTALHSGQYQIFEGVNDYELFIIEPNAVSTHPGSCNGSHVNAPGSYITNFNEYSFTIDYRITPKFNHRPGAYEIIINFCLFEVDP